MSPDHLPDLAFRYFYGPPDRLAVATLGQHPGVLTGRVDPVRVLSIEDASVDRSGLTIVRNVSVEVAAGSVTALLGGEQRGETTEGAADRRDVAGLAPIVVERPAAGWAVARRTRPAVGDRACDGRLTIPRVLAGRVEASLPSAKPLSPMVVGAGMSLGSWCRRPGRSATGLAVVVAVLLASVVTPARADVLTPVVFVHGQQGSAQQWQSNAKRFSGNGYPDRLLHAFEYDTSIPTNDRAVAELDAFLAGVRARTGASAVDVVAHSRGTTVMHAYLAVPERAAGVRRYVNVDGRSGSAPPGGVPTLALWGSLQPNGAIGGATNVYLTSLGHTETTTSADGYAHIHRFLRGRDARTTMVLPEPPGAVRIAGRATFFPQNEGVAGLLRVWELDERTGARRGTPRHAVRTAADGAFGPLHVNGRKHYELELVREGALTNHFYFEPFERSDRFLRLQVSRPGGIGDQVDRCPGHTAVTVVRNREWWADQAAPDRDHLEFDGVDVLAPAVAPKVRQVLAAFAFDDACDRASTPGVVLPPFGGLPFLTATDTYLPADPGATGTIRVTQRPRGTDASRTVAIRNWPSDAHAVTVQFKDYLDVRPG